MNYHTIHEKLLEKLCIFCLEVIVPTSSSLPCMSWTKKDSASAFLISSVSLSGSDLMGLVSDSSNLGLSLGVKENKMYSLKK